MAANEKNSLRQWRVIVVGGHTRSIGKTQLVCDLISAFRPANWIAGKITQYGHGVCAQNGENCACAPDEHVCAINWESQADTGTDSARFLSAGARRSPNIGRRKLLSGHKPAIHWHRQSSYIGCAIRA